MLALHILKEFCHQRRTILLLLLLLLVLLLLLLLLLLKGLLLLLLLVAKNPFQKNSRLGRQRLEPIFIS